MQYPLAPHRRKSPLSSLWRVKKNENQREKTGGRERERESFCRVCKSNPSSSARSYFTRQAANVVLRLEELSRTSLSNGQNVRFFE